MVIAMASDHLLNSFSKTETEDNTGGNTQGPGMSEFAKKNIFDNWETEQEDDSDF